MTRNRSEPTLGRLDSEQLCVCCRTLTPLGLMGMSSHIWWLIRQCLLVSATSQNVPHHPSLEDRAQRARRASRRLV